MKSKALIGYTPELATAICEAVATTPRGLLFLCASNENFPPEARVSEWLRKYPEFRAEFDLAKLRQADLLFDQCLEIADDDRHDTKTITRGDGSTLEVMDFEWVARSKLKVETRLKMAGKLSPKKYGDKIDVNASVGAIRFEDALEQLR